MKSFLRICLGVLAGVAFFVGLALVSQHYPAATRRIWGIVMGFGFGGLLVWFVIRCLRLGVTHGKFTRYERNTQPFHFWFFVLFYSLVSLFFLALGTWSVLSPKTLPLK